MAPENVVCKETLWIPHLAVLCHTEWLAWILAQRPNSETSTGTTHGGVVHSDYLLKVATWSFAWDQSHLSGQDKRKDAICASTLNLHKIRHDANLAVFALENLFSDGFWIVDLPQEPKRIPKWHIDTYCSNDSKDKHTYNFDFNKCLPRPHPPGHPTEEPLARSKVWATERLPFGSTVTLHRRFPHKCGGNTSQWSQILPGVLTFRSRRSIYGDIGRSQLLVWLRNSLQRQLRQRASRSFCWLGAVVHSLEKMVAQERLGFPSIFQHMHVDHSAIT